MWMLEIRFLGLILGSLKNFRFLPHPQENIKWIFTFFFLKIFRSWVEFLLIAVSSVVDSLQTLTGRLVFFSRKWQPRSLCHSSVRSCGFWPLKFLRAVYSWRLELLNQSRNGGGEKRCVVVALCYCCCSYCSLHWSYWYLQISLW